MPYFHVELTNCTVRTNMFVKTHCSGTVHEELDVWEKIEMTSSHCVRPNMFNSVLFGVRSGFYPGSIKLKVGRRKMFERTITKHVHISLAHFFHTCEHKYLQNPTACCQKTTVQK